jgi:beta-glucosidase-like glycosyl hydrolase
LQLNGVSSCGNPLLMTTMLRQAWQSDAIIQTDCCDSIQTMSDYNKSLSKQEALAKAVNDGLGVYFGYWVGPFRDMMQWNLGNGTIKPETVVAAGQRVILSFMRLGFFDDHSPDYPFRWVRSW